MQVPDADVHEWTQVNTRAQKEIELHVVGV